MLATAAALVLAGCAGGSPSSAHQTGSSGGTVHQSLAQRYTKLVSDGDHELLVLSKQLNQANGDVFAIQTGFRRVASTYSSVATSVRVLPFPAHMHKDVASMVTALVTLSHDASQGAESVTTAEFNLVFSNLASHQQIEVAANTTVNHDLGINSIS